MSDYPPIPSYMHVPEPLPNASAVLALGIISGASLFVCCCLPVPPVLSVIALVLGHKDRQLYRQNPGRYSSGSYDDLTLGWVLSIVSPVLYVGLCIVITAVYAVQIIAKSGLS